ncbi:MAG: hypothetical protein A2275_07200 [Bacteroidetes bacterium RIFOXYA12_FULL_35_11]|nr:MAG: hypothetical protein A2X01_04445 [Bacteroidetes bacterium GWF2_35_48]OFY83209.1 MAG: hypothetical protein A2275_07200 [Bacteroidetes bacterium RIFOXYA12_FULL_35_11]OFY93080.1 MAG: hypothetical protein A2491_01760 [Bacteroidetes bacterium RIFOXYC12_FULL_35_7]OFY96367.1 MAG: hypothetical protein A2309_02115 [Bacteroidetes bacterium RIFOXYB2_FULL_35_7]HBX53260.1 hypothetical protein [Bacteroidales bacterium]
MKTYILNLITILLFYNYAIAQTASNNDIKNMPSETILEIQYGDDNNKVGLIKVAGGVGPTSFAIFENYVYVTDNVKERILIFKDKVLYKIIENISANDIFLNQNNELFTVNIKENSIDIYSTNFEFKNRIKLSVDCGLISELKIDSKNNVFFFLGQEQYVVFPINNSIVNSGKKKSDIENYSISYVNRREKGIILKNSTKQSIEIKKDKFTIGIDFLGIDMSLNSYYRIYFFGSVINDKILTQCEIRKYNSSLNLTGTFNLLDESDSPYIIKRSSIINNDNSIYFMRATMDKLVIEKILTK